MGKINIALTAALFALFSATNASAALVTDDGMLSIEGGSAFTTSEAIVGSFPDGNWIFGAKSGLIGATLSFSPGIDYIFEYMGKEASDTNMFAFSSGPIESLNTGSNIGDNIVVAAEFASSWYFDGSNSSAAIDPSAHIFMAVTGNSVWLGFDDRQGGHIDYDDMVVRVSAVSAVPVPAAIWLFGTALIGFVGMSRKTSV
jgi:hypothetical protein